MRRVPRSNGLPEPLSATLASAAQDWLASPDRPRPPADVVKHWDSLVEAWVSHRSMPLLVRKSGDRGVERRHPSGRAIVCVDNSPAHWTLACAIAGDRPTVEDLHSALTSGEWPVVFAMSNGYQLDPGAPKAALAVAERVRARVVPAGVQLTVAASAARAVVFVDGKNRGTAPVTIGEDMGLSG